VDATVFDRDGRVFLKKRCEQHGDFEAHVYGDAAAWVANQRYIRPGKKPVDYSTSVVHGCPHDCGLCPDHEQHACVGIIEINSACDMDCPLCFAAAGRGFNLTLTEVESALDSFVRTEGTPEVVQFSGGEPSIHPEIIPMLQAAADRNIRHIMLNTNGKRIARDDDFVAALAEIRPAIYFQFDGFEPETWRTIRGEPAILDEKMRALDRLAEAGCPVILIPAVVRGVNEHEVGRIIEFALSHPAVFGVNFQPAFHAGRFMPHDPLLRLTNPDVIRLIADQTNGTFREDDFIPIPCCYPSCNSATYAYVDGSSVTPIPRVLNVDDYMDLISNRVMASVTADIRGALEALWSTSSIPGSPRAAYNFDMACAACGLADGMEGLEDVIDHMFMIVLQDFMDPWTFNRKIVARCCKEILLPDGKQIPFCAYNNAGYREQARAQLSACEADRNEHRRNGRPFEIRPLTFDFKEDTIGVTP
jgi:hypothetical protein